MENHKKEDKSIEKTLISVEMLKKTLINMDVQDGLDRIYGNIELYVDILGLYSQNNSDFSDDLRRSIAEEHIHDSLNLLHKMKGVTGNIGATNLNRMIKELEHRIKNNKGKSNYEDVLDEIDQESTALITQIECMIEIINKLDTTDTRTRTMCTKDMIQKFKEILVALTEYDTKAKQYYGELNTIDFGIYNEAYMRLGEYISDYNFELATGLCAEIITQLEER